MERSTISPDLPYFHDGDGDFQDGSLSEPSISRYQFGQTAFEKLADDLAYDPNLAYVPTRITYDTKTEPDGIIVTDLRTENDAN